MGGRTHTLDAPLIDGVVFAIGLQAHEAKSRAGQSKSTPMHSLLGHLPKYASSLLFESLRQRFPSLDKMVGAPFSRAAHNDDDQATERGVSGGAGGGPVRQVARAVFLPALLATQGAGAEVMVEGGTLLVLLLCAPCQCLALALQPGLLRAGVDSAASACVAPAVIFQASLSSAGQAEGRGEQAYEPFWARGPSTKKRYQGIAFPTPWAFGKKQ